MTVFKTVPEDEIKIHHIFSMKAIEYLNDQLKKIDENWED